MNNPTVKIIQGYIDQMVMDETKTLQERATELSPIITMLKVIKNE